MREEPEAQAPQTIIAYTTGKAYEQAAVTKF
jgi:hypothetical protein